MKRSGYLLVVAFVGFGCFSAEDLPTPSFDSHVFKDAGGMSSSSSGMGGTGGGGGMDGGAGGNGGGSTGNGQGGTTKCGNGKVEAGEACDDTNDDNMDGCTSKCECGVSANMTFPDQIINEAVNGGLVEAFTVQTSVSTSCYVLVKIEKPWHDALLLCNAMGMHLVYFDADKPRKELDAVKSKLDVDTWVGAIRKYPDLDTLPFIWLNGKSADDPQGASNAEKLWALGQPDNDSNSQNCALISKINSESYLYDRECLDTEHFLCESP